MKSLETITELPLDVLNNNNNMDLTTEQEEKKILVTSTEKLNPTIMGDKNLEPLEFMRQKDEKKSPGISKETSSTRMMTLSTERVNKCSENVGFESQCSGNVGVESGGIENVGFESDCSENVGVESGGRQSGGAENGY